MLNRNSRTKKISIIAAILLAAFTVIVYSRMASQSPAPETASEAKPPQAQRHSGDAPSSASHTTAAEAKASRREIAGLSKPRRRSAKSGAVTEFNLFDGDIGYVDVNSILQARNPYSVVALLKEHGSLTGADESLEIEISSAGGTHRGHMARFSQIIGGIPTDARGSVAFYPDGSVYALRGEIFDSATALESNMVILPAEAEAIATEAARRFVAPRGQPLRVDASAEQLRYAVDSDGALRAEWRVLVGTYGPYDSLEVVVAAGTGRVVGVRSVIEKMADSGCAGLKFRVCDATAMTKHSNVSCGTGLLHGGKPVLDGNSCVAPSGEENKCSQARYKGVRKNAWKIRDYIKGVGNSAGKDYLDGVGGADCRIDILINVDSDLLGPDVEGQYDPKNDVILIEEDSFDPSTGARHSPVLDESLIAHEVLHAVAKGSGDVEHGLVFGMEALHIGGNNDNNWTYGQKDFTKDQVIYKGDTHTVVGHAVYRIYKRMGAQHKDEVFRFALEVAREQETSLAGFRAALVGVSEMSFSDAFQQAVAAALVEMDINDTPPGTISMSALEFIEAKMRALAKTLKGEDAAWASAAADAVRQEIYRRFGLDDDEPLRSPSGGNDGGGS